MTDYLFKRRCFLDAPDTSDGLAAIRGWILGKSGWHEGVEAGIEITDGANVVHLEFTVTNVGSNPEASHNALKKLKRMRKLLYQFERSLVAELTAVKLGATTGSNGT